jgi:pilus assembly protein Flp/PilA
MRDMEQQNKNLTVQESEAGASMLEYALLAALIAVVCIAALTLLGGEASKAFSNVGSSIAGGNG